MVVLDLVLSIKRGVWRRDDTQSESADRDFAAVRPKVVARDGSRCTACGLQAEMQDVHHLDDDHANNSPDNLATADPLCHGVHHIGQVGLAGEGRLIYLPELSQVDVNHLQRTCFIALEIGEQGEKEMAAAILKRLLARAKVVENSPWQTSAPADFAGALKKVGEEEYAKRGQSMEGLRLVYHPRRFLRYMPSWLKSLGSMPTKSWRGIYEGAVKKVKNA